jgi:hypothetical protein
MKGLFSRLARFGRKTGRVAKLEHVFEPESQQITDLFRFDSPAVLDKFRLMTDAEVGGKSTARFFFDEALKCAVLEGLRQRRYCFGFFFFFFFLSTGHLDLTPAAGVSNSGFAAIVSRDTAGPWNLEDFDALLVRGKMFDKRIFVANIKCPSVIEEDLWQSFMIGEHDKQTEVVMPFSKFVATHRGFVEGQHEGGMDSRQVECVGILMAQRRAGPFRIEISSISAINSDTYQGLKSKRWTGVSSDSRDS